METTAWRQRCSAGNSRVWLDKERSGTCTDLRKRGVPAFSVGSLASAHVGRRCRSGSSARPDGEADAARARWILGKPYLGPPNRQDDGGASLAHETDLCYQQISRIFLASLNPRRHSRKRVFAPQHGQGHAALFVDEIHRFQPRATRFIFCP